MKKHLFFYSLFLVATLAGTSLCYAKKEVAEKKTSEQRANELFAGKSEPIDPSECIDSLRDSWTDPAEEALFSQNLIQAIAEVADERKTERLLATVEEQNAQDKAEDKKKLLNAIKKQNTLLTSFGKYVGVYKRDLVESGLLLTDFFADIKLYQFLTQRRIDHIVGKLLGDTDELVATIKRVNDSHARYDERAEMMSSLSKVFSNKKGALDSLLNPLRRYVDEQHSLAQGYIPFNRKTLVPLLARWAWEKTSSALKNRLIVQPDYFGEDNMDLLFSDSKHFKEKNLAHMSAFDENKNGKLVRRPVFKSPFSLSTGIKGLMFMSNPVQGIQRMLFSSADNPWLGRWKFICKKMGLNLPDFLFSDATRLGLEFVGMAWSVDFFDKINQERWREYVVKNRELLLRKILTYRRILARASSEEQEIKAARDDIRAFVEKGHESSSWIPGSAITSWWDARDKGRNVASKWLGLGAAVVAASWLGRWWYGMKQ